MNLKTILSFLFGQPNLQKLVSKPAKDMRPLLVSGDAERIAQALKRMKLAHADRSDDRWAPTQFHG